MDVDEHQLWRIRNRAAQVASRLRVQQPGWSEPGNAAVSAMVWEKLLADFRQLSVQERMPQRALLELALDDLALAPDHLPRRLQAIAPYCAPGVPTKHLNLRVSSHAANQLTQLRLLAANEGSKPTEVRRVVTLAVFSTLA